MKVMSGCILLVRLPIGCIGGMGSMWKYLTDKCSSAELFLRVRRQVCDMTGYEDCVLEQTKNGVKNVETISADEIRAAVPEACNPGIQMVKKEIEHVRDLERIIVCGSGPEQNPLVRQCLQDSLQECCEGCDREVDIKMLGPDIKISGSDLAGYAVHLTQTVNACADINDRISVCVGASIRYSEDAEELFKMQYVGFRCNTFKAVTHTTSGETRPSGQGDNAQGEQRSEQEITVQAPLEPQVEAIVAVKHPGLSNFRGEWETLIVDTEPSAFTLELYAFVAEGSYRLKEDSETGRPLFPLHCGMPMESVTFNLDGLVKKHKEVWVMFEKSEAARLIIRVRCRNRGGNYWEMEKTVKLYRDRHRLIVDDEAVVSKKIVPGETKRQAPRGANHRGRQGVRRSTRTITGSDLYDISRLDDVEGASGRLRTSQANKKATGGKRKAVSPLRNRKRRKLGKNR